MTETTPAPTRKAGTRPSGRPQKTSRGAILACAIAILEREPGAGVSLNRIAREIDISAMAIYNYFTDRSDLLQALTAQLLADLIVPTSAEASWQEQISAWAYAMRAHFKRYPYLIQMLRWDGHTSVAWMQHTLFLNDALAAAGLRDDALTQASLWVCRTLMGTIFVELSALESAQLIEEDMVALNEPVLGQVRDMLKFMDQDSYYDNAFQYTIERTLEGLALQIAP